MENIFSDRISDVPRSFIREILKVAISKDIISFAGGLPNRDLFPIKELEIATQRVYATAGADALQYSNTEGFLGLREYIASKYKLRGLDIKVDNILITTGSQQGLDLLGKTFLNEGDSVIMEEPGYLGAIQALSVYRAEFLPVHLRMDGMAVDILQKTLQNHTPKLMYTVPNFQNPSGISYSEGVRIQVADTIRGKNILLIEDDPYGELRFSGTPKSSFKQLIPEQTILLGSFSKTVVPSFRIGWIVAPDEIMEKLIVAKQASDLHTNYFCQRVIHQYVTDFDNTEHIKKICKVYGNQCNAMIESIEKYFPAGLKHTSPEGGMFVWVTLPNGIPAIKLFDIAIKKNVAFVPGNPFYTNKDKQTSSMRLNFSCVDEKTIEIGIKRLGEAIREVL
jgi:2-aminoadipate transaminase